MFRDTSLIRRATTRYLLAVGASSIAISAPASAEETANADEIVVTARKTAERLQDVPISISAVSGDQLRDRGAVDVKDVMRSIPGLSFSNVERGLGNYNIRGISTVASSPTVGIYLDDIPLTTLATTFSGALDPVFFDMERMEVLKGPQGTLYGGSSMGGAIKYVRARPNLTRVSGSAAAGIGTTAHGGSSYNAEGVVNVPLVNDKLALRAGVFYRRDGGFIDNEPGLVRNSNLSSTASPNYTPLSQNAQTNRSAADQNRGDTYVGRVAIAWQPDPTLTITPSVFYQRYKQENSSQFFIGTGKSLSASYRLPQPTRDESVIYDLNVEKDFDSVKLTSITAYFDRKLNWGRDYSYFIAGLVPPFFALNSNNISVSHTKQFSQELRLSSGEREDNFKWVVGLFYSNQKDNLNQVAKTLGLGSLGIPGFASDVVYTGDTNTKMDQYAAFGEVNYKLTDKLELTAGIRAFQIKQVVDALGDGPLNGGTTVNVDRRSNEKGVNPKFGLSYKITPNNMLFVSASKGFRPGGPNRYRINPALCSADLTRLGISGAPDSFQSDSLWSYELGTKNQFAGGRLTLNGAFFMTDWKKIQQQIFLQSCGFAYNDNAGTAKVKGVELEAALKLAGGFDLGGNATLTDAKIDKAALGTSAQNGDEVLNVPKWMASAYVSYGFDVGSNWSAKLKGEYQYQSQARLMFDRVQAVTFSDGVPGTVANAGQFRDGYGVVNAALSAEHGATSVRLYVNNVFDSRPLLDIQLGIGSDVATTLRPRTIGLEVRQKF